MDNEALSKIPPDRFWPNVRKTDTCWIWEAGRNDKGYGTINFDHQKALAHRYIYTLINGPIPEGMLVCHECDNPPCVNPDHLFLGTNKDNTHDMMKKGRARTLFAKGNRYGTYRITRPRKLPPKEILIQLQQSGLGYRAIARIYQVNRSSVQAAIKGKRAIAKEIN